jgi:taurine dioxygenase
MSYESITVEPVSPHIGAEIGNIDLTKPLPNKQVEELHHAFTQYQVIFFRDQQISFDDQIRLGRYFGPLGAHVGKSTISKTTDNPLVRKFHYDEKPPKIHMCENFITTKPRSKSPARIFTPTNPVGRYRRSAAFSTITRFRPTAAATPCLPVCMRPTTPCRPT